MKLSVNWLKKYIEITVSPEKLAEILTMSGTAVEKVENKNEDSILSLEITTNRPDCLSILGIAREVSTLTGKKINFPTISGGQLSPIKKHAHFSVVVEDKKACPLYTARLIQNVSIQSAPSFVQKNLESVNARPINNAVDATNFVMFEMGQPLHAFDSDKIIGGQIIVRFAKKDEKFLGLDDVEYTLDSKTLVIADKERAIAIAGVIGGKLTEVTNHTKNILLESASFDPALVRQASRKFKVATESSYRFERGVDIQGALVASERAADLIKAWAGGSVTALLQIGNSTAKKSKPILLETHRVSDLLGVVVSEKKIIQIFNSLGLKVQKQGKNKISLTPPSFRPDLIQEADLLEEIVRIEGFDKVPTAIPITRHPLTSYEDKNALQILDLKKFLANIGFNEIVSYSLLSKKAITDSKLNLESLHKIKNPVSAEQEYFRPSLLPGMLGAISFNVHRKAQILSFFEIGNRYILGREETMLSVALYGDIESSWKRKESASFYDLKGILQNIFSFLKLDSVDWSKDHPKDPFYNSQNILKCGEATLGYIGSISQAVLVNWDIPKEVFYAEISLNELQKHINQEFRLKPIPKFPLVKRDIAFVVDEKILVADLASAMKKAASPLLQEVILFDEFKGKAIPSGKRSLAFSLAYQKETGTFTDEEIQALQHQVGQTLKENYKVEFRS